MFDRHLAVAAWAACASPRLGTLLMLNLVWFSAQGAEFTVTTASGSGAGSLAQAITDANENPGPDRILFNIPGANRTIQPAAALPAITEAVVLDGTSQPGYAGVPIIELNGTLAGSGTAGLRLLGGNCSVRGLAINRFGNAGIVIQGPGGNVIENNYIGSGLTGTASAGNGGAGILISRSAGNIIGGIYATQRNVISGGNLQGVYVAETASFSNCIQGNYIGTAANGILPLGNQSDGITLFNTPSNTIGGSVAGAGNVISGNGRSGITLADLGTRRNLIQGNVIGLDFAGSGTVSNAGHGIALDRAADNVIGGRTAAARNIISGNGQDGIEISGSTAGGTVIQGNYIGTDAAGTSARGNRMAGVTLRGVPNTLVGGTLPGAGNVISGNRQEGIFISTNSTANRIEGNYIGLDAGGTYALGNHLPAVAINSASFNIVGGPTPAARNVISGNDSMGVWLLLPAARSNLVQGNYIGTDVTGRTALKNGDVGVQVEDAPDNLIGGTAAGNLVSGNGSAGISLRGGQARGNRVEGNLVGTDVTGLNPLGNTAMGIFVLGAPGNTIGGVGASVRNVISGNGDAGICLLSNSASGTIIRGNFVGTDITGMRAVPNGQEGLYILWSSTNLIGGALAGAGNVFSGNTSWGIFLTNSSWNVLQGNSVGVGADGVSPLANGRGVPAANIELGVEPGGAAHDNLIGGTVPGAGNRIAFAPTVYSGVRIRHAACTNNWITGNSIFSNGFGPNPGLGINLGNSGVNAIVNCNASSSEGGGIGGNLLRNYPELTNVVAGSTLRLRGKLNSAPGLPFTLEFFANLACQGAGYGEGHFYLGQALIATNRCTNYFSVTLPVVLPAGFDIITATATDPYGNTSEFSACQTALRIPDTTMTVNPALSDSVQIGWPDTPQMPNLSLWETQSLSEPVTWEKSTNAPVLSSGRRVATMTTTNGNRFFRLDFP